MWELFCMNELVRSALLSLDNITFISISWHLPATAFSKHRNSGETSNTVIVPCLCSLWLLISFAGSWWLFFNFTQEYTRRFESTSKEYNWLPIFISFIIFKLKVLKTMKELSCPVWMNEWMNAFRTSLLSLVKITFITWHLPVCCVDKSKNNCFVKYGCWFGIKTDRFLDLAWSKRTISFFFPSFHFPSLFINFGQQEVCKKIITWLSLPPILTSLWESSFLTFVAGVIALHSYFNLRKLRVWAENVAVTDVPLNEGDNKFKVVSRDPWKSRAKIAAFQYPTECSETSTETKEIPT